MTLATFLDSPSNRMGLCSIIGAVPPVATILLRGSPEQIAIALAIGQVCSGLLKILAPDNTAAIAANVVNASSTMRGEALISLPPSAAVPARK